MKLGPRTAAKHMALHGTMSGESLYSESRFGQFHANRLSTINNHTQSQHLYNMFTYLDEDTREYWTAPIPPCATFRVSELLEHWYIKTWFSQRKAGKKQATGDDAGLEYNGSLIFKMLVGDLRKSLSELGLSNQGKKQEVRISYV